MNLDTYDIQLDTVGAEAVQQTLDALAQDGGDQRDGRFRRQHDARIVRRCGGPGSSTRRPGRDERPTRSDRRGTGKANLQQPSRLLTKDGGSLTEI